MTDFFHFAPNALLPLLHNYGNIALFVLLAVGIFGLPIPDETILLIVGYLMAKQHLSIPNAGFAAISGSIFGITVSYCIGFFIGKNALVRYGRFIGITHAKLDRAHNWFERFGKWLLVVGYYIPGVRHFTGLVAGATYLHYWRFALFAYTGAIIWATTFMTLGYFFFGQLQKWNLIS
jgi:membrane protein DedA with SNARE-associated domain